MSAVKQAPVSGVVVLGPRSLLAVGAAGSIDHDFSNDSQLEVSHQLSSCTDAREDALLRQ